MAREGSGLPSSTGIGGSTVSCSRRKLAASAAAGGKGDHQDRPVTQIAQAVGRAGRQQFGQHIAGDGLGALAKTLSWRGSDRQPNGRGGEGAVEAAPFGQCRPVRQPPAHRGWRVRTNGFEKTLAPKVLVDVGRHAVVRIGLAALRVPEVMRDEFQKQRLGRRPGQGASGGGHAPGFEIGEIRGEGAKGIVAHALVDQMAQRLDILVGEQFGELVATLDRQHGGDGVEFLGASLDGGQ